MYKNKDRGRLGRAFYEKRRLLEKSQQEVASEAGISRVMYFAIENGTRGTTVETAAKVARSLEMDDEFVELWSGLARDAATAACEEGCV